MRPVSPLAVDGKLAERRYALRAVHGLTVTPLAILCALCALLACALQGALSAGVARAEVPRLVSNGNFASNGGLGVAVDQSSGDVFVTGFLNIATEGFNPGSIEKFDASNKLLSPPSPFAEGVNYGAAVNPTNGRSVRGQRLQQRNRHV